MNMLQLPILEGDMVYVRCKPSVRPKLRVGQNSLTRKAAARMTGFDLNDLQPCFGSDLFDSSEETCSTLCEVRKPCGLVFPKLVGRMLMKRNS